MPIDATLLHADEWAERLRLHNPIWLLLMSHPMPWVLRLNPTSLGFNLVPQLLQSTMLSYSLREWSRVHKHFNKPTPDVASGRETLMHLLRTYVLLTSLVVSAANMPRPRASVLLLASCLPARPASRRERMADRS